MTNQSQNFTLHSRTIGALPILNRFIERMQLFHLLSRGVPQTAEAQLIHADVILILVRSICLDRHPVYALGEWAARYDSSLVGLKGLESKLLNDDRVGRAMDGLFDADRAPLMTEIVLKVIQHFEIDLSQLHNDSTSVKFSGQYEISRRRKSKDAVLITEGHSKDHRPDLKQLVFSLSVSRDGAVPIHFKTYDGNRTDDTTHIETWETLRRIAGSSNFIYVADCKLCTRHQMEHIANQGGKFITVLPQTRSEDRWFKQWILSHQVDWQEVLRRPAYKKTAFSKIGLEAVTEHVYWGFESPLPSSEGYRIIWILSSQKREQDARSRQKRMLKTIEALDRLKKKTGPKGRLKTKEQITEAVTAVFATFGSESLFHWKIVSQEYESFLQKGKGRPGKGTEYRRVVKQNYSFEVMPDDQKLQTEAAVDGIFPLITNASSPELATKDVLLKYKYQPYLEKRHEQFKDVLDVAPVFLKNPHRVEALMFVYFISLMLSALIERETRVAMKSEQIEFLPLYPEARKCKNPATARILEVFSDQRRNDLLQKGELVQTFLDPLTPLQRQLLKLLKVQPLAYAKTDPA